MEMPKTIIAPRRNCDAENFKVSRGWLKGFLMSHQTLKAMVIQSIECCGTEATTANNIWEHIARIKAEAQSYNIESPLYIFNIEESGVSFKDMTGRKTYGIEPRKNIIHTVARTVGKLEHVKLMSVVTGVCRTYKPLFVFPGMQLHHRTVEVDKKSIGLSTALLLLPKRCSRS